MLFEVSVICFSSSPRKSQFKSVNYFMLIIFYIEYFKRIIVTGHTIFGESIILTLRRVSVSKLEG